MLRELTATQSVVERKTTIPILSNFLLEAEGDSLTITATDLDQAIRTSAAGKVKKPGACTIPARKLYDYIKLLPDGDISIKLLENHWVQIRSGRSNTKMVGMARANYPQVPEFPAARPDQLSSASLQELIGKTIFAISNEESRYTLNGALLIIKAESRSRWSQPTVIGWRISRSPARHSTNISGEKRTLIPRKALQELQSLLSNTDAEQIDFADDEHTLFFRVGHRTLTSRKLTGQFPNFEAVHAARQHQVRRGRSSEALMRPSSASPSSPTSAPAPSACGLRKRAEDQRQSSTESGECEDTIDTPYNFDPIVVGFNSVLPDRLS